MGGSWHGKREGRLPGDGQSAGRERDCGNGDMGTGVHAEPSVKQGILTRSMSVQGWTPFGRFRRQPEFACFLVGY